MLPGMVDTSSDAVVSDDGLYRYELERWWGDGPGVLWVMLNPSTADATQDDPTIRRCRSFTKAWGHSGFGVVNLFALRATKPTHLLDHPDPIGPRNEYFIRRWLTWNRCALVIAAWGAWKVPKLPDRDRALAATAEEAGRPLWCLGKTKSGDPRHPLYVRADQEIQPWPVQ